MEIIDHRLIGSLRVDLFDRDGAEDAGDDGAVFQTSTIEALLDGAYEGDLSIGELLAHGDLGVGTVDHLDGELIVIGGEAWVATADGTLSPVPNETGTPFAAVCRFRPGTATSLQACADFEGLTRAVDELAPRHAVVAMRVDAHFDRILVRSVARQDPPYPPLRDVVADQTEWELTDVAGSLVGFRFPARTDGLEVPGWHIHAIDDARTVGGHVMDVAFAEATVFVDEVDALHVEVPAGIGRVPVGAHDRRDEIAAVEGRRSPG